MTKKIIISIVALTLAFVVCFAACNEAVYTDPSTGNKYLLVTDEDGNHVYSDDGELLVYETDKSGKIVKDEDGNKVTQVQGFIGQIEENGTVEDYAYRVALPKGWKSTDTKGVFENTAKKESIDISIAEYFYDDYYKRNKAVYENIISASSKDVTETVSAEWTEDMNYENAGSVTPLFTLVSGDLYTALIFFENSGNVYKICYTSPNTDEGKADFITFINSITYKKYTYYDDITKVPSTDESTTTAK